VSTLQQTPIPELDARASRRASEIAGGYRLSHPSVSAAMFAVLDLAALSVAAAISVFVWSRVDARLEPANYLPLWPVLLTFLIAYATSGLYPGFGRNPVDELRRLSLATSLVYLALAVTAFLLKEGAAFSRAVFLLAWAQSLAVIPLARSVLRHWVERRPWWGEAVVVIGAGEAAYAVSRSLAERPELGLRPVLVLADPRQALSAARPLRVRHAILAGTPGAELAKKYRELSRVFRRVTIVPELSGLSSLWVEARDLGGVIGLDFRQRLLMPGARGVKRVVDLGLILATAALVLPLVLLIAAAIKLTSAGPAFYRQVRYGRNGETFTAWKFRTMVRDASAVLARHLEASPTLRQEWRRDHKLRHDPRVTAVGRVLRRTSLDELPQIWNVLIGEMSVVGPRPIVAEEIARYGDAYELYSQVTPGITGLWQVSGRNDVTYEKRVDLDTYYIRNWSPWLDLYILARTLGAVLFARGAY
jgi:Undecaprenyl-phosphate galactose phosphotransferase WbaP